MDVTPDGRKQWDYRVSLVARADGFRLPAAEEWECACRAGTSTMFCFGDEESRLADYDWYFLNSEGHVRARGGKLCNSWGLFDMHGNVREMCEGWVSSDSSSPPAADPPRRAGRSHWAITGSCGGGWSDGAWRCRSASRNSLLPDFGDSFLGFRVALVPSSRPGKNQEGEAKTDRQQAETAKAEPKR